MYIGKIIFKVCFFWEKSLKTGQKKARIFSSQNKLIMYFLFSKRLIFMKKYF